MADDKGFYWRATLMSKGISRDWKKGQLYNHGREDYAGRSQVQNGDRDGKVGTVIERHCRLRLMIKHVACFNSNR